MWWGLQCLTEWPGEGEEYGLFIWLKQTIQQTVTHTNKWQLHVNQLSSHLPLYYIALVPSDLNYCNIVWVTPHRFSLNKLLQVTCMRSDLIIAHTHSARRGKQWCPSTLQYILMVLFPLNSEDTESAVPSVQVNSITMTTSTLFYSASPTDLFSHLLLCHCYLCGSFTSLLLICNQHNRCVLKEKERLTKPLLHLVLGSMQNVSRYTTVHQI